MVKDFQNRIYAENVDMTAITDTVQIELDILREEYRNLFDDAFPKTATEKGVINWENILGIVADPINESLDFRRGRILNRLASNTPYTERSLQAVMDSIMGISGWSYELDYNNYQLDIKSLKPGRNWLLELNSILEKIIPTNIVWTLHIYLQTWQTVKDDFGTWQDVKNSYMTWNDVLEDNRRGGE